MATQESEKEAFVQAKEAQEHEVMDASSPDAAKDVTEADKVQDEEGAEPKEAETTDESGDVGALMDLGEKKSMDEERPATVLTPEKKSIKAFFKSLTKKRVVLADAAVATEEPVEEPKKKDGEEDEESKSTTSDQGTQVESTESDSEKVDAAVDSAVATKEIDTQTEKVTKKYALLFVHTVCLSLTHIPDRNFFAMFKPSSTPTKKAPAIASA